MRVRALPGYQGRHVVEGRVRNVGDLAWRGSQPQDVTAYFDTIPHDKLMKVVASRVVDGSMLALIKMFLVAPVIDEREGGAPRRPKAGTPQGGVVSPLLANIYLHLWTGVIVAESSEANSKDASFAIATISSC